MYEVLENVWIDLSKVASFAIRDEDGVREAILTLETGQKFLIVQNWRIEETLMALKQARGVYSYGG